MLLTSRLVCALLSLCGRRTALARLLDCLGVAVCVVAAFIVLVEVLVVVLSLVAPLFAVDARGMRRCATFTCGSLCLSDHPHPSLRCLELLLHFFRRRPRS